MKYFILVGFLMFLTVYADSQNVYTKDGILLGTREGFISSCVSGAEAELMKFNGVEINTIDYCTCMCDNLMPTLSSEDVNTALENNSMLFLFQREENIAILTECLSNINFNDELAFDRENFNDEMLEIAINICIKNTLDNPENNDLWTYTLAEEFCDCALNRLVNEGWAYKEIKNIQNTSRIAFNEISIPCMNIVFGDKKEQSDIYKFTDIKGGGDKSIVNLVDFMNKHYKVKIEINGMVNYYLFDTGANDLVITTEVEKELLINGSINKESYIGEREYTLANNEKMKARLVNLNNVKIGEYYVNNVTAAIVEEGILICGLSFLKKFKKWELNEENNLLILYK